MELKYFDTEFSTTPVGLGGDLSAVTLNLIPEGAGSSERIGRQCTILSISWRFNIVLQPGVFPGSAEDTVRLIMYLDRQTNGGTSPAVLPSLLEQSTPRYQAFYQLGNEQRFDILFDKTFSLNATSGGGDGASNRTYSKAVNGSFFTRCMIPIDFEEDVGGVSVLKSNNIGVMAISSGGRSNLVCQVRLRFTG